MATYNNIKKIKIGDNIFNFYSDYLPLTGGQITGPVTFGDAITIDEATIGDLVVNGGVSFTNNIQANTINGVAVGSSPKFTDTVTTISTTGNGNAITAITASNGVLSATKGTTFLTGDSTLNAAKLSGAIPSAVTATTQASTDNSTKIATTAYVTTAIANLPEPMIFKGSVGTNGTITSLPTAAASNEGWTYKVITALSSPAAKVGDTVISNGSSWVVIPSGDEPSGTVTSVAISNGGGLSVSGSPITSSGTITISHADTSSQASSSNSGRTYIQSLTLDTYGHVTGISTATETVTDTNTWRTIQVNGTDILGSGTGTGKLNLKAGSNVSVTNSSGTVTIASTDTNTWRGIQDNLTSTSTTESLSANQGRLLKNTKAEYRSIGSCTDYQRVVIGLCELSANANSGTSSHTSGSIVSIRSNGLVPEYVSQFVFQDDYSTAKACNYSFIGNFENTSTTLRAGEGFRACTFTYNSKYYAGLEFYQTQARSFYWYGESNFEPFLVAYYNFNTSAVLNTEINNSISLSTSVLKRRNIMADVSKVANSVAWGNVSGKPTATGSKATGISIGNHATGTVIGVQSSTTTASKATAGTAISIPNVTSAGSASNWVFENITVPVAASATACDDITSWSAGSGSASLTMAIDSSDSKKLNITFSHTHTAPTLNYTARSIAGVSGSVTASHVKSGGNGTAPTLGTAISITPYTFSDVTVPIKNTSASTFVTSATHTVTDNGHTHSIS